MEKKSRDRLVNKIKKAIDSDNKVISEYKESVIDIFFKRLGIFLLYFLGYRIVFESFSYMTFEGFEYVMIFITIPVTFVALDYSKIKKHDLSSGKTYFSLWCLLLRFVSVIFSLSPLAILIQYYSYNEDTGEFAISFLKAIMFSPIVFLVMCFIGWFWGSPGGYSQKEGMSKYDYVTLRIDQELAGLDPDKIPPVISSAQVKKMSKADWYELGMDLKLAGYDVFKR